MEKMIAFSFLMTLLNNSTITETKPLNNNFDNNVYRLMITIQLYYNWYSSRYSYILIGDKNVFQY